MIGLDTNVLVRYIVQDHDIQSGQATQLIESLTSESPGFIGMVAIVELTWVLKSCYKATKPEIITTLETILRTREIVVEGSETVWQALRVYTNGNGDFADCLIERCAHKAGCDHTLTFDKKAVQYAGMHHLADNL